MRLVAPSDVCWTQGKPHSPQFAPFSRCSFHVGAPGDHKGAVLLRAMAQLPPVVGGRSSIRDAFHGLSAVLMSQRIGVVCNQETRAPESAEVPDDQPCRHDGPTRQSGREAGFLFHESI